MFFFSTPVLIGHLWQLKTVVFLHFVEYMLFYQAIFYMNMAILLELFRTIHRHLRKDRLINGLCRLPCLSHQYCQWLLQKKENALEDVALVVGTQHNFSNLYPLDIYGTIQEQSVMFLSRPISFLLLQSRFCSWSRGTFGT